MPTSKSTSKSDRLEVQKTYKLYIGGKFPRTESGRYVAVKDRRDKVIANLCHASRKDLREAVAAARSGVGAWSGASAYNRGQILYRMAEMLEGRAGQFVEEIQKTGGRADAARREVARSIDRLVYYAGWTDKFQQVFSSVNPVASSHFNFSMQEPTGVVTAFCPDSAPLLGLVSCMAPALCGGNAVLLVASEAHPLPAVTLAEVLSTSDVPAGAVNILTGSHAELLPHAAAHMDINALILCGVDPETRTAVQTAAADNVKRVLFRSDKNLADATWDSPYLVLDTCEVKTTWHPVGA